MIRKFKYKVEYFKDELDKIEELRIIANDRNNILFEFKEKKQKAIINIKRKEEFNKNEYIKEIQKLANMGENKEKYLSIKDVKMIIEYYDKHKKRKERYNYINSF
jgi:hypothetical protein